MYVTPKGKETFRLLLEEREWAYYSEDDIGGSDISSYYNGGNKRV